MPSATRPRDLRWPNDHMDRDTAATPGGIASGRNDDGFRPRFRVEDVVVAGGQAFVLTVRLDLGEPFHLGDGSTLGGRPVVECLDLPVELRGMPSRHEVRAIFCLADPADADRLTRGAEVELVGASRGVRANAG